jgi:hypothetical protein
MLGLFALAMSAATPPEIPLPPRPAGALKGDAFAASIAALDLAARENAIVAEIRRGNVPAFWRRFVPVKLERAEIYVAPDYLAIGADDDYFLAPVSPATAQRLADELGCRLPTRKMVDAIYQAATLRLAPTPIPPSAAMTTVAVFAAHNELVRQQRQLTLADHPLGELVAGHKKDVVVTPRLATAPGKVAIYGWHRADGTAIQPLFLGHAASWVDYSHGVRLVLRAMRVDDQPTTIDAVLADPQRCASLSDEGPMANPRYVNATDAAALAAAPANETNTELQFETGVRVVVNAPAPLDPHKPVRLILYTAPAGNTIEQTLGRRLAPGDDWHFDIQHIAAQTRWLRERETGVNLVVACIQCAEKSWPTWRRQHADATARIVALVEALRRQFPSPRLVLAGHSAGGSFIFGYLDGVERIPDDVERIAFLDSDYAYDSAKGHDAKLAAWVGDSTHCLCVLAYQDYLALLDGKTFVSEAGGTWGRSQAMLRDLGSRWPFTAETHDGLQHHVALAGRVQFWLKENPEKIIWHTRQVELNGFIHALLVGTPRESQGYAYLGPRVYDRFITSAP